MIMKTPLIHEQGGNDLSNSDVCCQNWRCRSSCHGGQTSQIIALEPQIGDHMLHPSSRANGPCPQPLHFAPKHSPDGHAPAEAQSMKIRFNCAICEPLSGLTVDQTVSKSRRTSSCSR